MSAKRNHPADLILSAHPAVQVIVEPDTRFHVVGDETALLDFDLAKAASLRQRALLVFKAPRDTHRIDELFLDFQNARLLWLTRPVEPVVASMCKLRVTTDSWAFTHAPREARKYLQAFPADRTFADAFSMAELQERSRAQEIMLGTLCWIAKERSRGYAWSKHREAMHVIDYVNLVQSPRPTTRRVCQFIELAWTPAVLSHHRILRGERIGGTQSERPIDTSSLEKWRSELSTDDLRVLRHTVALCDTGASAGSNTL